MCRVPPGYSYTDVIGYTGNFFSQPTVYFRTGDTLRRIGRFTQRHEDKDNLGWHEPPRETKFFGNVSEYMVERRGFEDMIEFDVETGRDIRGTDLEEGELNTLVEVKEKGNAGDTYLSTHVSRNSFNEVTDDTMKRMLFDAATRPLGPKVQDGFTGEWYFSWPEDPGPAEPAGAMDTT